MCTGDSRQYGPQVQMPRSFWFLHVQELLEEPAQFLLCLPTFKEELSQRSAGTKFIDNSNLSVTARLP